MTVRINIAPLLCALTVCTLTQAQPVRAQDSYVLKRVYKAGEIDRYKMAISIDAKNPQTKAPMKLGISIMMTEATKEVKEDGTVVTQTTLASIKVNSDGTELTMPDQTITFTYDKTGRVVKQESSASGSGSIGQMLGITRSQAVPDKALTIGEPCKFEVPVGQDGKLVATGVVTLIGLAKDSKLPADTLIVKSVVDTPLPNLESDNKLHLEAITYVESKTGKPIKMQGTITGQVGPLNDAKITFTRSRLNPDDKKQSIRDLTTSPMALISSIAMEVNP